MSVISGRPRIIPAPAAPATMSVDVDVNLRIPTVKAPTTEAPGYAINNADVRFVRRLTLAGLPKPGAVLDLETRSGIPLLCEVLRADWSEAKDRFIVYCKYANRSMTATAYHALLTDPDWERRPLL